MSDIEFVKPSTAKKKAFNHSCETPNQRTLRRGSKKCKVDTNMDEKEFFSKLATCSPKAAILSIVPEHSDGK